MGYCFSKNEHNEVSYHKLGYDLQKYKVVKMIFDDFDLKNNNQVNLQDLDNYNHFINDFFSHRINHLKNHYDLNNSFKRNNRLASIKMKESEVNESINTMLNNIEITKMEISNSLENRKGEIKLEIKKLEQELVFIENVSEIKKTVKEEDIKIQIESMKKGIQNEKDSCELFFNEKCARINDERISLESLVSRNDTQEMKEKFLSYMTGNKDHQYFTLLDILLYFKNKSYEDILLLLKYINKGKYNDVIKEDHN